MLQALLPFLTAIALSAIAAFYSVIGLAQIFPGSFWPIILMGSVLEIAKLVTVSWLYNNWAETNRLMKYYFSIAIILLMLITSMGIFGYLSRAHIESNVVVGANTVQLKTRNDVYYQMYKEAKKKAKMARDLALSSYLEVKRIKNTYMLDDLKDSDDSDLEMNDDDDEENDDDE